MESPLYIPQSKKWKGLTVYCYKCKTNVADICKETGKPIQRCAFGNKHAFKVYVHVPGTDNARKTKKLDTRDVNEAIRQVMEFEKRVKANNYQVSTIPVHVKANGKESENMPHLLIHGLSRYIGWLHNEAVPAHRKKERSEDHIKDVQRAITLLVQCLKKNGYPVASLSVQDINDEMIGQVYEYLLNEKGFANRTFNKYFSHYTSFLTWYANEYDVPVRNWFEKVERKRINANPESISREDYEALLEKITPENGIKEYGKGKKPVRNMYRPWLADGIRLAIETGRRREEVISLKFNDIVEENDGASFLRVEDFKVNRIQNRTTDSEKKFVFIPITDSLSQLLNELDYEKYKGTDTYILAPDVKISRTRIMSDVLSHGFAHFYSQLNTGKKLTFKCLRKTYITNLSIYMGGNAKAVTGHSDNAVIERHYLDKKVIAKAAQGFEVFGKKTTRKEEIQQIRNISKENQNREVNK